MQFDGRSRNMDTKPRLRTNLTGNVKLRNTLLENRENVGRNITQLLRLSSKNRLNNKLLQQNHCKHSVTTENRHLNGPSVNRNRLHNSLLHSKTLTTKLELKNKLLRSKIELRLNTTINSSLVKIKEPKVDILKRDEDFDGCSELGELSDISHENAVQVSRFTFDVDKQIVPNEFIRKDIRFLNDPRTKTKIKFINAVSSSLITGPNLKRKDDKVRLYILKHAERVASIDPEFVLKVAVYTRRELNIRSAANLLVAFAASDEKCRPYLQKYYNCAVSLPSDWMETAEQCQMYLTESRKSRSLPAALRRAMVCKFSEFDEYQLAKYNKAKKASKPNLIRDSRNMVDPRQKTYANAVGTRDVAKNDLRIVFTQKILIRLLHLSKPADFVMGILEKRYPRSLAEFWASGLSGMWDETRSGKKMKLATPETWETQLCLHRNLAATWHKLIDNKKLPFMAMLRNLRNLIVAKVKEEYQDKVVSILTNKELVIRSKQFPFRFLTAYNIMRQVEDKCNARTRYTLRKIRKPNDMDLWLWRLRKVSSAKIAKITGKYKAALSKSIDIATLNNVAPIRGHCVILCDCNSDMKEEGSADKALHRKTKNRDIALLMALMCKHVCESSDLHLFGNKSDVLVQLVKNKSILDNLDTLTTKLDTDEKMSNIYRVDPNNDRKIINHESISTANKFPEGIFDKILIERTQVDTLIVFSNEKWEYERSLCFAKNYRIVLNEKLLFVFVNLGKKQTECASSIGHPNNIRLSGFSDQLLRYVAERGSSQQLRDIDQIDVKYKLKGNQALRKTNRDLLSTPLISVPKWRTARVFVSSTFRDMHGERDLLLRSVFPQLRARALDLCVDVHDIDLRWGITEQEAEDNKMVEICLTEAAECDVFVGLLGSRYGSIVTPEQIPESERFDWVREYSAGSSITELEFQVGLFGRSGLAAERAVVCIRDNSFLDDVPDEYLDDFSAESHAHRMRLEQLKSRVRSAHFPLIDNYACEWKGEVNGVVAVSGLDGLGTSIVDRLWSAFEFLYSVDDVKSGDSIHENFAAQRSASFSGRNGVLSQCLTAARGPTGLIVVNGKTGSGKTAFMSKLCVELMKNVQNVVIPYFVDAVSGDETTDQIIEYFCNKIAPSMKTEAHDGGNTNEIHELLESAVEYTARFVLLIDGVEELAWIPNPVPPNVQFICTLTDKSVSMRNLNGREALCVPLSPLVLKERAELVRANLLAHRKKLSESLLDNQLNALITKHEAYSPLFLTFACHQMRLFLVFENMSNNLRKMPNTVSGLLSEILVQMERMNGSLLVLTSLKLVLMSKEGVSEEELYGILNLWMCSRKLNDPNLDEMCRLGKRKLLSPSHFAKFYQSVKVFFNLSASSRDNALKMSHKEIVSVVSKYCKSLGNDLLLEKCIAVYYLQQIDPTETESWLGRNPKAFERVISRLVSSGNLEKAATMITDLKFLFAKSNVGLCQSVLEDFILVRRQIEVDSGLGRSGEWKSKVDGYQQFFNRHRRALSETPSRIFQLAMNEKRDSIVLPDASGLENLPRMIEWLNKSDQEDRCTAVYTLSQAVNCVSTFGCVAAAGLLDGSVQFIDLTTSKIVRKIKAHCAGITCIGFVDSNLLVCASESSLSSWDVESGNGVTTFEGHRRKVAAFILTDRSTMVSVSWDRSMKIWDVRSGRNLSTCHEKSPISCCVKHPVRNDVAIGLWDGSVRIWNLVSLKRIAILHGHKTSVTSISLSTCGRYLAASSLDGRIIVWSSRHGFQLVNFRASSVRINEIVFNGKNLWSVGDDCAVKVWSSLLSNTEEVSWSLPTSSKVMHVAGDPLNIHRVVVAYEDSTIVSFNVETGDVLFSVRPSTSRVSCVYCNQLVYVGYLNDNLLMLDDSESGVRLGGIKCEHLHAVTAICRLGTLVIFGCADGNFVACLQEKLTQLKAHDDVITCVAAHPVRGDIFASVSRDRSLKVWNVKRKLLAKVDDCHADWVNHCVWATRNADHFLVTASNDNSVKLWSFVVGSLNLVLVLGHTTGPAIFVDVWENCVVCGASDGNVKMFTLKGSEVLSVEGEASTQFVSRFQKDTRQIKDWYEEVVKAELGDDEEASGSDKTWPTGSLMFISNGSLKNTTLLGTNKVAILSGHAGCVETVCVLADETVVTGSVDQTLMTWNGNGRTDCRHDDNKSEICSIVWDKDERLMISCCRDGSVSFWRNESVGGEMIRFSSFKLNSECVNAIHLTRNDKFHAVCDDGVMFLCEFGEGLTSLSATKKLGKAISCSAYCDVNDALAFASADGHAWLNDVSTGKSIRELAALELSWVVDMKCVDEKLYMLTSSGGLFFAHTRTDSRDSPVADIELYDNVMPRCFDFARDSAFIGLSDGVVIRTSQVEDDETIRIHAGGVKFCVVDRNGRVLITASNDRTVKVLDMFNCEANSKAAQFECSAPVCALSFSPVNNLIVCGDFRGKVYFLRLL